MENKKIPVQVLYSCPACHKILFKSIKHYPANSPLLLHRGPIEFELEEKRVTTTHIVQCDAWENSESYLDSYRPEDLPWVYDVQITTKRA